MEIRNKLAVLLKLVCAMIKEPWLLLVNICYFAVVSGSRKAQSGISQRPKLADDEFQSLKFRTGTGRGERLTVIRRLFDFIDEDGDGKITVEEMNHFLVKLDGLLADSSYSEMLSGMLSASILTGNYDRQIESIDFCTFLLLHDDVLGVEREMSAAGTGEDVVEEVFGVFDENGDGFISAEELQRVLCALGLEEGRRLFDCQEMIRSVDANFDGKVDISEFRQLVTVGASRISAHRHQ